MDRFAIILLASALGAAGGVLVAQAAQTPTSAVAVAVLPDELEERLKRIEDKLDDRPEPLTLRGNPVTPPPAPAGFDPGSEQGKALLKAIADTVKSETRSTLAEMQAEEGTTVRRTPRRPQRKRMALSDVARELELSSSEESALRDHYDRINEKAIKLLAGDEGNVDEVRADLESVKKDPSKRMTVFTKYMPKIFPKKIGEFVQLRTEMSTGVTEAVGKEKADKIRSGYVIEESDPFGMEGRRGFR